ncbi:MAG: zinc ribbon domain-containing protein [bacterium]|nr:zinc ribbon domain-containing protein [bacterium]
MLIWAFMARNLLNRILSFKHGTKQWFNGLWTFLFMTYYFNYKVNQLNEAIMYDTHATSFRYGNDKAVIYQCPQCGRDVAEGLRFCPRCGQLLVSGSSQ